MPIIKDQEAAEKAAEKIREMNHAEGLIGKIQGLKDRAKRILDKVEKAGNHSLALAAIKELRGILELMAKLTGDLQTGITIHVSPEWISLRTLIINAVEPFPEAQQAIIKAIENKGG